MADRTLPPLKPNLAQTLHATLQRHIIAPLLNLLRVGASPRKLAWSLAVGFAVGINPLLGTTTLACFIVALLLRLNLVASQISNHLVYPLQLALFFVFIRIGEAAFGTGPLPLGRNALLTSIRHHPLSTTRLLWTWEWHALIVWFAIVSITTPLFVALLTPLLQRLLLSMHHAPVIEQ